MDSFNAKLTPDAKFAIASKLSGNDLIKLCAADTEMRRLCNSSRFNPIWIKLLKEDYNTEYNGENGYMEYLQATRFYRNEYWSVVYVDTNDNEVLSVYIFKNREDAISSIMTTLEKRGGELLTYPVIKGMLEANGGFILENLYVSLTAAVFETRNQINYEERYNMKLKELAKMVYPDDEESQADFIYDLRFMIEELSEGEEINPASIIKRLKDILGDISKQSLNEAAGFVHRMLIDPTFI